MADQGRKLTPEKRAEIIRLRLRNSLRDTAKKAAVDKKTVQAYADAETLAVVRILLAGEVAAQSA